MTPGDLAISAAAVNALESPCAKSKRGVVIFAERAQSSAGIILGAGHNGPPGPMKCLGADGKPLSCQSSCSRVAVHAEERALRYAQTQWPAFPSGPVHLVHVKVDPLRILPHGDPLATVVAAGPPSCVTCSRTILDAKFVTFVWLYEAQKWHDEHMCTSCGFVEKVAQGKSTDGCCPKCRNGVTGHLKTFYDPDSGIWKRYTALEFHQASLRENDVCDGGVQ